MAYHGKYDSPTNLLRDGNLSYHEKVRMLESWRDDKEALIRASEEGMHGDVRPDLLRQIDNALCSLQETAVER